MTLFAHAGRIGLGSCCCVLLITGACLSDGWAEDQETPRRHSLISHAWKGSAFSEPAPPSASLPPAEPKQSHSLLPPAHRRPGVPASPPNEWHQRSQGVAEGRSEGHPPSAVTSTIEESSTQPLTRSARGMGLHRPPRSPFPSSVAARLSSHSSSLPTSPEPSMPDFPRTDSSSSERAVIMDATVTTAMPGIRSEGSIEPGS